MRPLYLKNSPILCLLDTKCVVEVNKLITAASMLWIVAGSIVGSAISATRRALAISDQVVEFKIRFIIDRHLLQSTGRLCSDHVTGLDPEACCNAICKNQPAMRLCLA